MLQFLFFSTRVHAELDEKQVARGETLYKQVCIACHGADLEGGIGPSLVDPFWKHGDSPEAILKVISKGIEGSEMVPYELIYPEEDRMALRDYLLSKQVGFRSLVRSTYARDPFAGKRFSPELFETVESHNQKVVMENLMYLPNNFDEVVRFSGKFFISAAGSYSFDVKNVGRTSIFINGEELYYSDATAPKETYRRIPKKLNPGVYDIEVLHEEKKTWNAQFHALLKVQGGKDIPLMGQSLSGSEPKVIMAGYEAKVIRKKIAGISPRALLLFLPNKVIVAYNPHEGRVEKVWSNARVNQTPSLPDRSFHASVVEGEDKNIGPFKFGGAYAHRYVSSQVKGTTVEINHLIAGKPYILKISPDGDKGCIMEGLASETIDAFSLQLPTSATVNSASDATGNFSITL